MSPWDQRMDEESPRKLVDKQAPIKKFDKDANNDDDEDANNNDDDDDDDDEDAYNDEGVVDLTRIYMIAAKT